MTNTETKTVILDFVRNWKPSKGMSQDLPGVPPSRFAMDEFPAIRELIAEGKLEMVELRGKGFLRIPVE